MSPTTFSPLVVCPRDTEMVVQGRDHNRWVREPEVYSCLLFHLTQRKRQKFKRDSLFRSQI
jgi:hypothetical protein